MRSEKAVKVLEQRIAWLEKRIATREAELEQAGWDRREASALRIAVAALKGVPVVVVSEGAHDVRRSEKS
jgi:predicted  nucleic acid-binding Zn-ribbon protein